MRWSHSFVTMFGTLSSKELKARINRYVCVSTVSISRLSCDDYCAQGRFGACSLPESKSGARSQRNSYAASQQLGMP
jgi:hypothetical protein